MRFIIGILVLSASILSYAEEPVDRVVVEELLEVSNSRAMVEQMYTENKKMVSGMAEQMGIKESEQQMFDKFIATVMDEMKQTISWEKMKEPLIDVYMKHYTKQEIEDLLEFYKTETGQSLLRKMPAVMSDSMKISQDMFKEFLPRIMELATEMGNEVRESRNKP